MITDLYCALDSVEVQLARLPESHDAATKLSQAAVHLSLLLMTVSSKLEHIAKSQQAEMAILGK
jgi:hypothetical protein